MATPEQNTRLGRNIIRALGAVMVVVIAMVMWRLLTGKQKMQEFCDSIDLGATRTFVLESSRAAGYEIHAYESEGATLDLVVDRRAMGRYVCEVQYENRVVRSRRYVLND